MTASTVKRYTTSDVTAGGGQLPNPVAAISSKQWGDDTASAEREPISGVWWQSPQRSPGAEPLVRGSGGEAPLKLKGN